MAIPQDRPGIRALRDRAGKTQYQVAIALGVPERMYVRWERGECLPSAANLIRLADFFRVHPRTLIPEVVAPAKASAA
jgi:transcriptional regulator with XRE-family HTH domain